MSSTNLNVSWINPKSAVMRLEVCPSCGILYGILEEFHDSLWRNHRDGRQGVRWYCPNGHQVIFSGEPESEKLKRQLAEEQAFTQREREWRQQAEKREQAAKGQVTKLKRRTAAGVCPCCQRTFKQLASHMKTKHPGFEKT